MGHLEKERKEGRRAADVVSKLGGAGCRFGDFLWGNLPFVGGGNPFINTKFSKPNTPISKSRLH